MKPTPSPPSPKVPSGFGLGSPDPLFAGPEDQPWESPDKGTSTLLDESADLDEPWQVIIFNDPVNLMSYVTVVIRRIFGYSETKARKHMMQIHREGKTIVWSGGRERAETYVQQLQSHQLLSSLRKASE